MAVTPSLLKPVPVLKLVSTVPLVFNRTILLVPFCVEGVEIAPSQGLGHHTIWTTISLM